MSDGNGSSSWVDLGVVKSQLVGGPGSLGSESFVKLIDVDIVSVESSLFQNLWNGVSWSNSHDLWWNTSDGIRNELSDDWKSVLFSDRSSSDENNSSSISGLGGVTGGGDTSLSEAWLQLSELVSGGSWSDSVVLGQGDGLGVSLLVSVLGGDWNNFLVEPSLLLGVESSSVRFSSEFIKSSSL